jgi:ribonuclease HI
VLGHNHDKPKRKQYMTQQIDNTIRAYTDGACKGNPGNGGWGFVMIRTNENGEQKRLERFDGVRDTTNNQMELMAAIKALEVVTEKHPEKHLIVTTDSKYVMDGITTWIENWKRNGWRTATKKSVKNVELWQQLDELNQGLSVKWEWVKGHSGHPENERADQLATSAVPKR